MSKIVTQEEIYNRCLEKGFKLLESYKRSKDLHKFLCIKHNEEHYSRPNQILSKNCGLLCCAILKGHRPIKYNIIDINDKLKIFNVVFSDKKYLGRIYYHKFKCLKHNFIFKQNIANLTQKKTLPPCCKKEYLLNKYNRHVKNWLDKGIQVLEPFNGRIDKKYKMKCLKHNFVSKRALCDSIIKSKLNCCRLESLKNYKHLSGKSHPHFNPNLTEKERNGTRTVFGLAKWKNEIKLKYNRTCQICGKENLGYKNCISHHLNSYSTNKNLATDINNGTCLCLDCHKQFHKEYGYGNNTKLQFDKFKRDYNHGKI